MPYIARVADGSLPILNIYGDDYDTPDGTGVRDYIHVMDLADGHRAALEFLKGKSGWHAFNLGTGVGFSVIDMVHAFEAASVARVQYQVVSRRPGDVAECYANPAKAEAQLRWRTTRSIEDMCASAWAFRLNANAGETVA